MFQWKLSPSLFRSEDSNKCPPGTPGTPGSRDLEVALRRLSLRRDNYLSEKRFFEEEKERKLAYLAKEEEKGGPGTPTESLFSLCSHSSVGSIWSGYSFTPRSYLPEKLQIVKPLEGDYSPQSHKSSNPPHADKENQNFSSEKAICNENDIWMEKHNQNQNLAANSSLTPPRTHTQVCETQSRAPQNHNQYLIFHKCNQSRIFVSASPDPCNLPPSSSLMELSSLSSSQPSLAVAAGLLERLVQQDGSLNLQHSFYFRHTQLRCFFEI